MKTELKIAYNDFYSIIKRMHERWPSYAPEEKRLIEESWVRLDPTQQQLARAIDDLIKQKRTAPSVKQFEEAVKFQMRRAERLDFQPHTKHDEPDPGKIHCDVCLDSGMVTVYRKGDEQSYFLACPHCGAGVEVRHDFGLPQFNKSKHAGFGIVNDWKRWRPQHENESVAVALPALVEHWKRKIARSVQFFT